MIYEARTYRLPRGTAPTFIKEFAAGYETRKKLSEMAALFYSEIGALNEVVHIWPYKDMAERERIRAEGNKDPNIHWPPKLTHPPEQMQSEIFTPLPFTPTMRTGKLGPVYEWREYMVRPGGIAEVIKRWSPAIEARMKLSPLAIAMSTECGVLNKFVHIWPYESLEHRRQVREEAAAKGIWPPKGDGPDPILTQANKILLPASISPAQ